MPKYAIGIDIGGTQTRVGLCSAEGEIHHRLHLPTLAEPSEMIPRLIKAFGSCCEAAGVESNELAGIGCSAAGTIDFQRGALRRAPHLPRWEGFPLIEALEGALCVELPIVLDNDANAAAWAVARFEVPGLKHLIYVTVSTGIGGGIVIDGRLYHGRDGNAAEVGHIILKPQGPSCDCGKRGCWEALASGTAIARMAKERLKIDASAEEVFRLAAQGDPKSRGIIEEAAFYLGVGLAALSEIFDPEVITLGGGLMRSWEQLRGGALEALHKYSRWETPIRLTQLGDEVGLLGAAALVFTRSS
jgi:glucokinase